MKNNQTFHYTYKITNKLNDMIYIGAHSTHDLEDDYMGSGKALWEAYDEIGQENFKKEILEFFDAREEAFKREVEIVNKEFTQRFNVYNIYSGGGGKSNFEMIPVKDPDGNTFSVSVNDPRYLDRTLVSIHSGKTLF